MMMNYKVFFITDACATLTDAEHGGTLSAMAHTFCDVRDTQSVLGLRPSACCTRSARRPAAHAPYEARLSTAL